MVIIKEGAAVALPVRDGYAEDKFDISLRIVQVYDVGSDQIMTRFDVLMNHDDKPDVKIDRGDQFNAAFWSSASPVSNLRIPQGIVGGFAFKAARQDLTEIFEGLAKAIRETK